MIDMVGIAVTILTTLVSIFVSYKLLVRKKRPCKILFLATDCINVYNKLSLDFDCLEIKANDKTIDNDLIFFSGIFVSNGHSDIKGENHKLEIQLPESCKWQDIKISSKSKGLSADIEIDQGNASTAFLSFDQFRMEEFVTIKGLIECSDASVLKRLYDFYNKIDFSHRIEDTENVKVSLLNNRQLKLWPHLLRQIPFLIVIVLSVVFFMIGSSYSPISFREAETEKLYQAQVNQEGNVVLRNKSSILGHYLEERRVVTPKTFEEKYSVSLRYEKYDMTSVDFIMSFGVMDLMLAIFLCFYNRNYFRDRKRMRKYIGEN